MPNLYSTLTMTTDHLGHQSTFSLVRSILNRDFASFNRRVSLPGVVQSTFENREESLATISIAYFSMIISDILCYTADM